MWIDRTVWIIHAHRIARENPFEKVTVKVDGKDKTLSSLVATYDAPYTKSTEVYEYIKKNLDAWVEKAIAARQKS